MRGRNLHLTGQLGGIDRLAGLLANQQFGQCWWSRQTADMTDQYAVGAHQHGRFLLHWTAEHHAATCCPPANGAQLRHGSPAWDARVAPNGWQFALPNCRDRQIEGIKELPPTE